MQFAIMHPSPSRQKGATPMPDIIETNLYDIEEIYPDCTVQILKNSITGEVSVGWWPNDNKPIETKEGN